VFWALPNVSAYTAAKSGLTNVTNTIRTELRKQGVSASTVYPGAIRGNGMFDRMLTDTGSKAPALFPTVTPERVARDIERAIRRDTANVYSTPMGRLLARTPRLALFAARTTGATKIFASAAANTTPAVQS
jgi:short-subunit dehydrogenase